MKKEVGITLVSLVVTIIVLIILAGVSINLVLGENGIITKSKQAKEKTEQAKLNEEIALNELYMQIEAEGGEGSNIYIGKLAEFKREIASAITDMGITTSDDADVTTMASNIRSLSLASSADKVSYDNTNSGLTSTNVQGAIDEVNNSLGRVDVLYNTTIDPTKDGKNITLNNKISDYKFLYVVGGKASTGASYGSLIPVVVLTSYINYHFTLYGIGGSSLNSIGIGIKYISDTSINVLRASSGEPAYLFAIYGVK